MTEHIVDDPLKLMTAECRAIDGATATLVLADGQEVRWLTTGLPAGCAVGTTVHLRVLASTDVATEREALAKTILNTLLKTESHE